MPAETSRLQSSRVMRAVHLCSQFQYIFRNLRSLGLSKLSPPYFSLLGGNELLQVDACYREALRRAVTLSAELSTHTLRMVRVCLIVPKIGFVTGILCFILGKDRDKQYISTSGIKIIVVSGLSMRWNVILFSKASPSFRKPRMHWCSARKRSHANNSGSRHVWCNLEARILKCR